MRRRPYFLDSWFYEGTGRHSSTSLSPQEVVAVLGKATVGKKPRRCGVSPFMTQLEYQSEGPSSKLFYFQRLVLIVYLL